MMKLKRKQFAIPAGLMLAGNIGMGTMTALGLKQGADAAAQQDQAMEEARIQSAKQNRALRKIAEAAEKNPTVAQKTVDTMQQKEYSVATNAAKFLAKNPKLKEGVGFAKDMGTFAWGKRKEIAAGALSGAAIAGAGYAADKFVQRDAKKNNIPIGIPQEQKSYSVPATSSIMSSAKNVGKRALKFGKNVVKDNWKSATAFGGLLGGLPVVTGYMADKQQYKDQIAATSQAPSQRAYAIPSAAASKGFFQAAGNFFKNPKSVMQGWGKGIKKGWTSFKAHPGQSTIDNTLGLMSGGSKGREKMVSDLSAIGTKSGNKYTQNVANFFDKHKKTAGITSAAVGMGVMSAGWGQGEKLTKSALKKVDKDAYKYQESKENQVQQ